MTRIHDVIITISVSVSVSSNHGGIISVLSHLLFCQLCSCQILPCLLKHNEIFTKCMKQWERIPYLEYQSHTLLAPLLHQLSTNWGLRDQWYATSMPDHLPSSIISQNPFFLLVCDYNEVLCDFAYSKQTGWWIQSKWNWNIYLPMIVTVMWTGICLIKMSDFNTWWKRQRPWRCFLPGFLVCSSKNGHKLSRWYKPWWSFLGCHCNLRN